eukprot:1091004-Pleurochrysis_carterae.AAC.1
MAPGTDTNALVLSRPSSPEADKIWRSFYWEILRRVGHKWMVSRIWLDTQTHSAWSAYEGEVR